MSRQDANAAFALSSFLQGTNATYIDDIYSRYEKDPASVDAEPKGDDPMSDSLATRLGRPFHAAAQTLWSALFLLFAWLVYRREFRDDDDDAARDERMR